jgi:hypothetical protein
MAPLVSGSFVAYSINFFTYQPAILVLFQLGLTRNLAIYVYRYASVSTGNTFQDILLLRETADNTERYI